ncbi:helix-turn-helix transcriptional regulator [Halomonas sp. WWR20]
MIQTNRKPTTVGEMLTHEFLEPLGLRQTRLAKVMGVAPSLVNALWEAMHDERRRERVERAQHPLRVRYAQSYLCSGWIWLLQDVRRLASVEGCAAWAG